MGCSVRKQLFRFLICLINTGILIGCVGIGCFGIGGFGVNCLATGDRHLGKINTHLATRHFTSYGSSAKPGEHDSSAITREYRTVHGAVQPVTRFRFSPEAVTAVTGMSQVIDVKRDTRLEGIRFQIQCLTGPAKLKAILMPVGIEITNYECPEPIVLEASKWKAVVLTFSDFTDTRSRMSLDADAFHSGDWAAIKLVLIPFDDTGSDQVYEWGSLEAINRHHRYRFH